MQFNSYSFLILFAFSILVHYSRLSWRTKKINLVLLSQIFYAAWNPPFIILMWFSAGLDFLTSIWMERTESIICRRILLGVSLIGNLGMLCYFKYINFLIGSLNVGLTYFNIQNLNLIKDLILPMGISFYTFQTLSYTVDVYRKDIKATRSMLDYFLYVSFFPQLVAGPIVRASDFLSQCKNQTKVSLEDFSVGICLFIFGIFEKSFIADSICSPIVIRIFDSPNVPDGWSAWVGSATFAIQVFADFAGYSTCAIGLAKCLGFSLMINFNYPYAASSVTDYWRRWHISLSTWLRDYIYIPLGGSRHGKLKTYRNLMLTMGIGGLWHGASWNYVVWGLLHGIALSLERSIGVDRIFHPMRKFFYRGFSLLVVIWIFVFFRVKEFTKALSISKNMLLWSQSKHLVRASSADLLVGSFIFLCVMGAHFFLGRRSLEEWFLKTHPICLSLVTALFLFLIATSNVLDSSFIYFQF